MSKREAANLDPGNFKPAIVYTIYIAASPEKVWHVLTKRLTIRGFIVSDFAARHGDFLRDMSQWVREGKVKHKEFVTEGLDSAPAAFMGLLKGANFGKQLVRVGPDKA